MPFLWLSFKDILCYFPPPEYVEVMLYRSSLCTQLQVTLSIKSYFSALHLYIEVTKCTVFTSPIHSDRKFEFQHDSKSLTFSDTRKASISDTNAGGIVFFTLPRLVWRSLLSAGQTKSTWDKSSSSLRSHIWQIDCFIFLCEPIGWPAHNTDITEPIWFESCGLIFASLHHGWILILFTATI